MAGLVLFLLLAGPVSSGNIAINPAGTFLAVANSDSNSVSIITLPDERRYAEITVGRDPKCVAWALNGNYVLVTNQSSASVSLVNVKGLRVVQTISVDAEPYGIVQNPQRNEVYVASAATNVVDVIHLYPTAKGLQTHFVRRIPVAAQPKGLALSADGSRLYVTHFLSGTVSVIDTSLYNVVQEVATGLDSNMAQKIAIHPSNGRAYVPHIRSNVTNRFLLFDTAVFPVLSAIDLTSNRSVAAERVDLSLGLSSAPNSGPSSDLDALATFVNSLIEKPSPFSKGNAVLRAAIRAGKAIFERPNVGCTQCHVSLPIPIPLWRFVRSSSMMWELVTALMNTWVPPSIHPHCVGSGKPRHTCTTAARQLCETS